MTRGRTFFLVRVGALLAVLSVVVGYAAWDLARRHARTDWRRPVQVALVLATLGPVDREATSRLAARTSALTERLRAEYARRGGTFRPIEIVMYGPVSAESPPPPPPDDGFLALVRHTWARRSWLAQLDSSARVDTWSADSRIYVVARPAAGEIRAVEGLSEQGGTVGIALVDLGVDTVDLSLFVATHELFYTLGATDKYDSSGNARFPDGYAEPGRAPRWPQRWAEIMSRGRPVSPGEEAFPETLDELAVGDLTAREIGWTR